jgi:hypothetical protein
MEDNNNKTTSKLDIEAPQRSASAPSKWKQLWQLLITPLGFSISGVGIILLSVFIFLYVLRLFPLGIPVKDIEVSPTTGGVKLSFLEGRTQKSFTTVTIPAYTILNDTGVQLKKGVTLKIRASGIVATDQLYGWDEYVNRGELEKEQIELLNDIKKNDSDFEREILSTWKMQYNPNWRDAEGNKPLIETSGKNKEENEFDKTHAEFKLERNKDYGCLLGFIYRGCISENTNRRVILQSIYERRNEIFVVGKGESITWRTDGRLEFGRQDNSRKSISILESSVGQLILFVNDIPVNRNILDKLIKAAKNYKENDRDTRLGALLLARAIPEEKLPLELWYLDNQGSFLATIESNE